MIKRVTHISILAFVVLCITGCDVHEWPDKPERVSLYLDMHINSHITQWHHTIEGSTITEVSEGPTVDNIIDSGHIRYVVRAYPHGTMRSNMAVATEEFVFVRQIDNTYNSVEEISLPAGEYDLYVWADLMESEKDLPQYNVNNFTDINITNDYAAGNQYRDAFRSSTYTKVVSDITDKAPDTLRVEMHRPLAKIEFVSNDLALFFKNQNFSFDTASDNVATKSSLLEDYSVVCYYVGYLPDTYNIVTDRHTDSAVGVKFNSNIRILNNNEASISFDYVLVNERDSYISTQLALLNKRGEIISLSEVLDVPIKRDCHTIMRGKFLTGESQGGLGVDPNFDDEFNIVLP